MAVHQEITTRHADGSPQQANGDNGHAKGGKARFDHIYNQPDPRPYFQTLERFGYRIPAHGQSMFKLLVNRLYQESARDELTVLDLCCSYGVNAALLNHDLTLDSLYERYRSPDLAVLSSHELAAADAVFYRQWRRQSPLRLVGLDTADRAVAYAAAAGLLAEGSSENLELGDASAELRRQLAGVGLITVTGGIGYISERTFDRVLHATAQTPWVASFVLRWVPYEPFSAILRKHGLVTEKLSMRTFTQRNFADESERTYVLEELARMGIDPAGKEAEGQYHADFYLSRPAVHQQAAPLEEIAAQL